MSPKKSGDTSARPEYDKWPRQVLRVADLFLDSENLRLQLGTNANQQSLINDLFVNENAMQILESIANNGLFPDERPVVIQEAGKYVTIEGNRRLAALKALALPEIVASKEASIRELVKKSAAPVPQQIEVVIAPDRDAARHFLATKHTQNTRRRWSTLRQAHFYKAELMRDKTIAQLKQEYPGVDIEKFLRLINIHHIAKSLDYDSTDVARKVHNDRTFPSSTLERLYDDKQVRDFLGFTFTKDGEVKIQAEQGAFEERFKRVVRDIVTKSAPEFGAVDSRTLNSEDQRREYIKTFAQKGAPPPSKNKKNISSKDFTEQPPPPTGAHRKLAPANIKITLTSPGLRRMLVELQGIDHKRFPNAAHDLLRSFLECSLKEYFEELKAPVLPSKNKKYVQLDDVLQAFINDMTTRKKTKLRQLASRIKSSDRMNVYSAEFLNATNHNPDVFSTPPEVEAAWDTMEPIFRYALDPPSSAPKVSP